jgi:uncharacterized protein (DUF1800 family)
MISKNQVVGATQSKGTGAASAARIDPAWAFAAYEPDAQRPWSLRGAGHLLRRAGFGGNWEQLQRAVAEGPQRSVDRLLHPAGDVAAFNQAYDDREASAGSHEALRGWWLRRMLLSPHALLEKMTLFWHGHFAANIAGVGNPSLMARHMQLLRQHALGRFEPMFRQIASDPAILLALDARANRKSRPNVAFARVLLESFCVGPGVCSQHDLQEAARALTGWFVLQDTPRWIDREHDTGNKRVLGQEGNWKLDDLLRIAIHHPSTPRFLVGKIYSWLVSETDTPSDEFLSPVVERFAKGYDILGVVETIVRSNWFFSPAAYRQRVKSPVELTVGLVRGLEGTIPTLPLGQDLAGLGQSLYAPPGTDGWAGGTVWVSPAMIVARNNLVWSILARSGRYGGEFNPLAVATRQGRTSPEQVRTFLVDLFLQGDVEPSVLKALRNRGPDRSTPADGDAGWFRQMAHALATLPEAQLA